MFKPDLGIFTNITEFDFEQIDTRLKETSFLNAGLKIEITDSRSKNHTLAYITMKEDCQSMSHKSIRPEKFCIQM